MSETRITRSAYGFDVELPNGKLQVVNTCTFNNPRRYGHVIDMTSERDAVSVYVSATGKIRVFRGAKELKVQK